MCNELLVNLLTTKTQNMKTLDLSKAISWLCAVVLVLLTLVPLRASETASFYIVCPADQWVTCEDEIWDLSIYGNAYYHDYNGDHDAGASVNTWNINSCNVGLIYRTWTVEDYNWVQHSCTQVIHVEPSGNFDASDITWPLQDLNLEGCNPSTHPDDLPEEYSYPTYNYEPCSLVAHSYEDQIFNFSSTCKKLIRKWTVIDWCVYDPNSGSPYGSWTYWQVIKLSQSDVPELVCLEDVTVSSYNCTDAFVELPSLEVNGNSCGGDFTIENNSPYADEDGANISGNYPLGTTNVKYTVHYGCGSKKTCYVKVTVADNKGPTTYCIAHVTVPLMGMDTDDDGINDEGMVEIWAKDLDFGSSSSCGHDPLSFSFSEDPEDMNKTFTCDQLGENIVQMWVTDAVGNQSYCEVIVEIQNNGANIQNCVRVDDEIDGGEETTGLFEIAGLVVDQFGAKVSDVAMMTTHETVDTSILITVDTTINVTLDSFVNNSGFIVINEIHDSVFTETIDTIISHSDNMIYNMTEESGLYLIEENPADIELKFYGVKTEKDDSRISKDDVLLLLDHLLGEQKITDPYQLLAGDTDDNNKLDFNDVMNLIAKVSEGTPLPTENLWRVVDASFEFTDIYNPFLDEIPAHKMIVGEVDKMMEDENFVAIYKGDVELVNWTQNFTQSEISFDQQTLIDKNVPVEIRDYIESVSNNVLAAYPNPFENTINFDIESSKEQTVQIRLYDIVGKQLLNTTQKINKGNNTISLDLNSQESGVLLYEIKLGNEIKSGRLIKQ